MKVKFQYPKYMILHQTQLMKCFKPKVPQPIINNNILTFLKIL